jgi:hypothetical protein
LQDLISISKILVVGHTIIPAIWEM